VTDYANGIIFKPAALLDASNNCLRTRTITDQKTNKPQQIPKPAGHSIEQIPQTITTERDPQSHTPTGDGKFTSHDRKWFWGSTATKFVPSLQKLVLLCDSM